MLMEMELPIEAAATVRVRFYFTEAATDWIVYKKEHIDTYPGLYSKDFKEKFKKVYDFYDELYTHRAPFRMSYRKLRSIQDMLSDCSFYFTGVGFDGTFELIELIIGVDYD